MSASAQDAEGNTLFHLAAKEPHSPPAMRLVEKLAHRNLVNPNLRNGDGKTALECLPKRQDPRFQLIKRAAEKFLEMAPTVTLNKQQTQNMTPTAEPVPSKKRPDAQFSSEGKLVSTGDCQKSTKATRTTTSARKRIEELVKKLRFQPDVSDALDEVAGVMPKASGERDIPKESTGDAAGAAATSGTAKTQETANESPLDTDEERAAGETVNATRAEEWAIDSTVFDSLEWEVICTADVWKILRDSKVPMDVKKQIICKVRELARGVWSKKQSRPLKGTGDLKLRSAKLSKGARILWEQGTELSEQCSSMSDGQTHSQLHEFTGSRGYIYAEVIRIWDIVLQHDNLKRSIEKIVKSHTRSQRCVFRNSLQTIPRDDKHTNRDHRTVRLPNFFAELVGPAPAPELVRTYVPPASPKEMEYHVLKFYPFSSNLVLTILNNEDAEVNFPFKVTGTEHDIINLKPDPPAPLLLLGRSGTGKTTCCLYRLWTCFVTFWQRAVQAGEALLPRRVVPKFHDAAAVGQEDCSVNAQEEEGNECDAAYGVYTHA